MKRFLLILLLFLAIPASSQTNIDSLRRAWEGAEIDSVKIKALHNLFEGYRPNSLSAAESTIQQAIELALRTKENRLLASGYNLYADFLREQSREDSAIVVAKKGLELATDIGFAVARSDALTTLGACYWQKGDFEQASGFYEQNLALAQARGDIARIAQSHNGLGAIHSQLGNYTKAMDYFISASEAFLEAEKPLNYAMALGNIGYIQRSLENYDSAISYFRKSDSVHTQWTNPSGNAFAAYNLSVAYRHLGMLDQAMDYIGKAIATYGRLGIEKRVSYCYFSKGEILREKEEYPAALRAYSHSLELSRKVDDSVQIGYSSMAVSDMFEILDRPQESISHLNVAGTVAERLQLDILAMDVHERLAKRLAKEGRLEEAYQNLERFIVLKDSLYTKEKRELASEIEAKYQNGQQEKEIALLASQRNLQSLQLRKRETERNAIIGFALLALLLALLLYNQYRIKQRSNRELQDLDRAKSDFFANISHEFRTPLTLIKGPIEQLEQNPDDGLGREEVKMIRRNTNRLLGLVDQLLDLSKVDQGKLRLKPTEGDVYQCLWTAVSSFNSHAAQRHMDFKVNIPDEVLWAAFDRDKFEKIIYNLLSNAFKFSDDGEMVSLEASYDEGELTIQVGDSGKGIPEDRLPYIFDRFYQVDSGTTKEHGGTGIGLALSKDLVNLMDGTLTVSSEEGKGTLFVVQLPLQKIETGRKLNPKRKNQPALVEGPTETFTLERPDSRSVPQILLVEDNEDMRNFIIGRLLSDYRVLEAYDGEDGLERAVSKVPDLIITDLMMPKMDGIQLCQHLKTDVRTSHIPVIMLTAKAGTENKIEGLKTGADDYLTKPFEGRELVVRVSNLITQRERLRKHFGRNGISDLDPKSLAISSLDEQFLEKVLDVLEMNYAESSFGVSQMRTALGMSKTQLHRKIKALTNETPGELLRNFRLKRAAQLLANKADTVTQVAYRVGFNNLSYFARCFKDLYGQSPSSYHP